MLMALAGFTANSWHRDLDRKQFVAAWCGRATTNKWSDKGKISLNAVPAYTLMYV